MSRGGRPRGKLPYKVGKDCHEGGCNLRLRLAAEIAKRRVHGILCEESKLYPMRFGILDQGFGEWLCLGMSHHIRPAFILQDNDLRSGSFARFREPASRPFDVFEGRSNGPEIQQFSRTFEDCRTRTSAAKVEST